jgi:hypothetical protein
MISRPAGSPQTPMSSSSGRGQHVQNAYIADLVPLVRRQSPSAGAYAGGFDGDIVDEWGRQSFPASDPPANW